jgi:hypothetical protein
MENNNQSLPSQPAPGLSGTKQRKVIITIALVAVAVGVGVWVYFILNRPQDASPEAAAVQHKTTQTKSPSATTSPAVSEGSENFPVPAMYPQYAWSFASTTFENGSKVLDLNPALNGSDLSPTGQFYTATNTDPSAIAWQQMDANAPKDQPEGFYGGDQNFLKYYDKALTDAGYRQTPLKLDQNLKITALAKPAYMLYPLAADGPHGTIRGYIKYDREKIRVVIISSADTQNEIFISNIVSIQDIVPLTNTK